MKSYLYFFGRCSLLIINQSYVLVKKYEGDLEHVFWEKAWHWLFSFYENFENNKKAYLYDRK